MTIAIILSLIGVGLLVGGYALATSVYRVMREQFDELMPQRMVDFAGFIDVPNSK